MLLITNKKGICFIDDNLMEEQYRLIIRNEIDMFRESFKQWVA